MQLTFLLDQITTASSGLIQTNLDNRYNCVCLFTYENSGWPSSLWRHLRPRHGRSEDMSTCTVYTDRMNGRTEVTKRRNQPFERRGPHRSSTSRWCPAGGSGGWSGRGRGCSSRQWAPGSPASSGDRAGTGGGEQTSLTMSLSGIRQTDANLRPLSAVVWRMRDRQADARKHRQGYWSMNIVWGYWAGRQSFDYTQAVKNKLGFSCRKFKF